MSTATTFDPSELNANEYILDVAAVSNTLALKWKTYLSTHRKMESMKEARYDMSNAYFLAYTREDKDKNNYLYTFYLYNLPITFSMDKYRKYFYMKLKSKKEIVHFFEKPLSEINKIMHNEKIGMTIFQTEADYAKFQSTFNEIISQWKFSHIEDAYFISWLVLYCTIWVNLSQFPFNDGCYEKKEVLLKKKSEDKIISTYSNKLFHLAMYGEDMEAFRLKP